VPSTAWSRPRENFTFQDAFRGDVEEESFVSPGAGALSQAARPFALVGGYPPSGARRASAASASRHQHSQLPDIIWEYSMKVLYTAAALAGFLIPSIGTAAAQEAAAAATAQTEIAVGAVIYDPQGGEVGKVDSVSGDNVVIDTGTNKVALPKASFGKGKAGPAIGMTKADIDAAAAAQLAQAQAALDSALIVGAEVRGSSGTPIGTIKEVTADQVVLNRPSGMVSLNKSLFANEAGSVVLRISAAELDAAAQAATTTAPAATPAGEASADHDHAGHGAQPRR
jgi:preprotein translocase subunit YajC